MATYTPKHFYTGQPGTTATTLTTAGAGKQQIIKSISICNTTSSSATLTLSRVASGGSASASNRIFSEINVLPKETKSFDTSTVLETGDFLSALQGTASAITLSISGVEVS